jgi:hypothetical protein
LIYPDHATRYLNSQAPGHAQCSTHFYEARPRKDKRGFRLLSDALPFGRLWYTKPDDAIDYAKFRSRSHHAVIRVYDESGNVIETHEHKGDFREPFPRRIMMPATSARIGSRVLRSGHVQSCHQGRKVSCDT